MAQKDMIGVECLDREVIMMAVDQGPYQGFMVQLAGHDRIAVGADQ